jgi:tRNA-specific 2-thiouridylase
VHSLSFVGEPITTAQKLECRVRYRDPRVAIEFTPAGDGTAAIKFESPQRALAPGQIMALYRGEELLGGAVFA